MSRLGSELITSNQHTAYPFRENALGLARLGVTPEHGSSATLPLDFLVDASIVVYSTVSAYAPISGEVHLASIVLGSDGWYTFTFRDETHLIGTGRWAPSQGRLVSFSTSATDFESITYECAAGRVLLGDGAAAYLAETTDDEFGSTLPFENTVLDVKPAHVVDIWSRVGGHDFRMSASGNIQLVPGYNMQIALAPTTTAGAPQLLFSAMAGAGMGVVPASEQTSASVDKAPMNLAPDKLGGIRIVGDRCYDIVPIGPNLITGRFEFKINGNCYACCTCDDYVAMGLAVKGLLDRTQSLHVELDAVHAHYSQALAAYNAYLSDVRRITGEVKAVRGPGNSSGMLNVSVSIVNKWWKPATGVHLSCAFTGGAVAVTSGTYVTNRNIAGNCSLDFTWPTLAVGDSISITYLAKITPFDATPVTLVATLETDDQLASTIYNGTVEFQP